MGINRNLDFGISVSKGQGSAGGDKGPMHQVGGKGRA